MRRKTLLSLSALATTTSRVQAAGEVTLSDVAVSVVDVDEAGLPETTSVRFHACENDSTDETHGSSSSIDCVVLPCAQEDADCTFGIYESGCCTGTDSDPPDCDGQCGFFCPPVPDSCELSLQVEKPEDCTDASCYDCESDYALEDETIDFDCLRSGTYIKNGESIAWAFGCGLTDEEEYVCTAWRTGGSLTHQANGLISVIYPCEAIVEGECGAEPSPDCPFDCAAGNLCSSFENGIEWFLGDNFFRESLFIAPTSGAVSIVPPTLTIGDRVVYLSDISSALYCQVGSDLQACAENTKNHGKFMSCVTDLVNSMKANNSLSKQDRIGIIRAASRSNVGYK